MALQKILIKYTILINLKIIILLILLTIKREHMNVISSGTPVIRIYTPKNATDPFCLEQLEKTLKTLLRDPDVKSFATQPDVPLSRRNISLLIIGGGHSMSIQDSMIESNLVPAFDSYLADGDYLGICAGAITVSKQFFYHSCNPYRPKFTDYKAISLEQPCKMTSIAPINPVLEGAYRNESHGIKWTLKNSKTINLPLFHFQGPCLFSDDDSCHPIASYRTFKPDWKTPCESSYITRSNGSAALFCQNQNKINKTFGRQILLEGHPEINPFDLAEKHHKQDDYDDPEKDYLRKIFDQLQAANTEREMCMRDILERFDLPLRESDK